MADDGGFVVDTPKGIEFARLSVFRARLNLEIKGLGSRTNTLKAYNKIYGTAFRLRKKALEDVERRIQEARSELHGR